MPRVLLMLVRNDGGGGGLIFGQAYPSSSAITISNCWVDIILTSTATSRPCIVGGILGVAQPSISVVISNCYTLGSISVTSSAYGLEVILVVL